MGRHFDADYREHATLRDGTEVVLRLVRAEDKALFVRAFANTSADTRYYRFFTHKNGLSTAELAYLTEIDQRSHVAIGALRVAEDGTEEGLGVARFVKLPDEPDVADPAIVVVDAMQGKGLGRLLFLRLIAAARERGVSTFRADVLADNEAMLGLLRELACHVEAQSEADGVLTVKLDLPHVADVEPPDSERARGPMYRIFALTAEGAVRVAQVLQLLPRSEGDE